MGICPIGKGARPKKAEPNFKPNNAAAVPSPVPYNDRRGNGSVCSRICLNVRAAMRQGSYCRKLI